MTTIVITATRQPKLPRIPSNPHPIPVAGRHTTIRAIIPHKLYALEYYTPLSDRPLRTEYYTTLADAKEASYQPNTLHWLLGADQLDIIKEIIE